MTSDGIGDDTVVGAIPRREGPVRVLHVDDRERVRERVRTHLEAGDLGVTVLAEDDPRVVPDRLSADPIDCVVSDYGLPSTDGLDLLATVRGKYPDLPFVLFTGTGSEDVASRAINAGVSAYVRKDGPEAYERLADQVRRVVQRYRSECRAEVARDRLLDLYERTDALYVLDRDWTVTYWNRRIADRTGKEPEAVVGENLWEVFPEAVTTELYDRYHEAMETGESDEFETYYEPGECWLEVHVSPVEGGLLVQSRDITARKERTRSEVLDRMGDGFFAVDDGWTISYANEPARRILAAAMGRDPDADEIEGRHLWEEIPDAVDTTFYEQYRRAMVSQENVAFEEYFEPLDAWFEVNAYPSETGLSVYFRDVTEQHRRRGELRNRERVLREMYEIVADRDRSFTEQIESLLALGRAELDTAYGTLSEIRGDDYVFEVVDADDDSVAAGDVVPVSATNCEIAVGNEETLVLANVARDAPEETDRAGYTEWGIACYLGAPVFVDDEVYGTFCFYDTEPRERFSEWEETLVDLMSRWVSYELERRQATERLQRQNEKLDRFASVVSHDLRNPLNSLEGWLELAEETGDDAHFERCYRAVDRMHALVDDLLTLARAGDVIDDPEEIELRELLEQSWGNVATEEATVRIGTDRTVRADPARLKQVLENLFRNAIEHGGDDVTVTVGDLDAASGFYVADDGPGIPADERERVFESGYSTAEEGTGFGLAIVEEIVAAHGWTIGVTDGPDGGARFEITGLSERT